MRTLLFILLLPILSFFDSCCYKVDCLPATLEPALISFSPAEMDTLIFRKFDKGSNFQNPKDSIFINSGNISLLYPYVQGDTTVFHTGRAYTYFKFEIQAGFDYEIFIPGANKLVRIEDIEQRREETRHCFVSDGNDICINPLASYKMDGETKTTEYIYIKK